VRNRLIPLLLLAAAVRLMTLGWDSGVFPHPDERRVTQTAIAMDGWFSDPGFYAYGSLHFQAVRAVTHVLWEASEYLTLILGGRVLSVMASFIAILIGLWMAREGWGGRTAILFVVLVAVVPLDLQQSHFSTVEAHHALWVVATLAACFQLARRPSAPCAVASGALLGLSLAVKVASLPLVLVIVAAALVGSRGKAATAARWLALAASSALVAFWLGQPFAFGGAALPMLLVVELGVIAILTSSAVAEGDFIRRASWAGIVALSVAAALQTLALIGPVFADETPSVVAVADRAVGGLGPTLSHRYVDAVVGEIAMITGKEPQPYTLVYGGTSAVLYPLRQLGLWGLGPGLLIACLAAVCRACLVVVTRWRRRSRRALDDGTILLMILLLWLVPMSVRLSTLEVKFLRYWQPLLIPAVLVAAWALVRLPRRRWRRPVIALVVVSTLLVGASYLAAFSEPHPHHTAVQWLDGVVTPTDVVAYEDWDDPLRLAVHDEGAGVVRLPSYGFRGGGSGLVEWCVGLAASDWVVMTSSRVRRTVLGRPELFDDIAPLYDLLFSGEAGFVPLTRVDRGPRWFGIERRVQSADESFVNYEFQRVVVFRRVTEVDAVELEFRALDRRRADRDIPGWEELERRFVEPLPEIEPIPGAARQLRDVVVWVALVLTLGLACWVLIVPLVKDLPDAGLGVALTTGWVLPAWLTWLGSELGLWRVGPALVTWVFLAVVVLAAVLARRRWGLISTLWLDRRRAMRMVATVGLAVGLFFLVVRAVNPAIASGEKPMDFSFLNAFVHADAWPTGEPWMSGRPLHYYYFGEVLAAYPIILSGCRTAVGYNLVAATIPALAAALLTSIGLLLARGRRVTALLVPLVVLLSGNLAWPVLLDRVRDGRFFDLWWATSRVIPSPYAIEEFPLWTSFFADLHGHFIALPVLLAALLWGWALIRSESFRWPIAAVCGLTVGVLAATNPWDLLVLTLGLGFGVLAAAPRPVQGLLRLTAAAGFSLVTAAPFLLELFAGVRAGAGGGRAAIYPTSGDFAPWWAVALHFGLFLGPLVALAAVSAGRWVWAALAVAGLGTIVALQMGSTTAALALGCAALFLAVLTRTVELEKRLGWSLALLGVVLVAACERFTVIDRMNTIFKVYNGVWLLLALALAILLLVERPGWRRRLAVAVWLPLQLIAVANLPLGVATAVIDPLVPSPRPTLDGQAQLRRNQPDDWFLVRTVEAVAGPVDTVAEAAGEGYSRAARVVMHTGRPTVVGWPFHLQQRGQSPEEIVQRQDDLKTLYASGDPMLGRMVLDRYGVHWVCLGDLERRTYELREEDPLEGVPGLTRVATNGRSAVYMVSAPRDGVASNE
jgi:YYY domain-containing protein